MSFFSRCEMETPKGIQEHLGVDSDGFRLPCLSKLRRSSSRVSFVRKTMLAQHLKAQEAALIYGTGCSDTLGLLGV